MAQRAYYERFGVVELQRTFYQPPRPATAARWRRQAPPGFEFTLKAFQAITHPPSSPTYRRSGLGAAERAQCGGFRDTAMVRAAWTRTLEIVRLLRAPVVVFQCPASFTPSEEHLAALRRFFRWAERGEAVFGWEPRGDWPPGLVRELCRELELVHVVDPFVCEPVWGTPRYYRLHGIGGYRHRYSDEELGRLRAACRGGLTYCMFNNVSMRDDALRFLALLGGARAAEQQR